MSTYETPLCVLFASHGGEIAGALRTLLTLDGLDTWADLVHTQGIRS